MRRTMPVQHRDLSLIHILVWGIAIVGILINALWITCPKWFSSLIYIAMGWVCILAITKILSSMPRAGFMWLLAGGIDVYKRQIFAMDSLLIIPAVSGNSGQ